MKLKYKLVFAFLIARTIVCAQNLTGTWEGSIGVDYCKIVLFHVNDSCFGYTYDTGMGYCKANFEGTFTDSIQRLRGKGTDFIERTITHGLCIYNLSYSKEGNTEYLKGKVTPKTLGTKLLSLGIPLMVVYRKISDNIDTTKLIRTKVAFYNGNAQKEPVVIKPIPAKDSPLVKAIVLTNELKVTKESRTSKLIQTIETGADSIKLVLYDNGETVTVFDNGKIIVERLALGLKPYEVIIPVNKNNSFHTIELMANNLGSIPPNTAYMLILAGKERYELRLSSDFSVNAQLNIKYKDDIK
jgi:hypothetical protein